MKKDVIIITGSDTDCRIVAPPVCEVKLVSMTENPLQVIGSVNAVYDGLLEVLEKPRDILEGFERCLLSPFGTPLEMIHYVFLIKNVTRAFTHQLVRYRIGTSYAQESLRFVNASGRTVLLPPELKGREEEIAIYARGVSEALKVYKELLRRGVPVQAARGVLPTNILTHIWVSLSHKTLQRIFAQRISELAQRGEWEYVLAQCKTAIHERYPALAGSLLSREASEGLEQEKAERLKERIAWRKRQKGQSI